MNRLRMLSIIILLLPSLAVDAQDHAPGRVPALLNGLMWRGPGATMEDLSGKPVVILDYVTWCPKCNVWSPDLFAQVKAAVADTPVIVVAVCTDEEAVPGPIYVSRSNFLGANILHAYHPRMDERLGVDAGNLFNAVLIGPDRNIVWKGAAGSYYDSNGGKDFVLARKIRELKNKGEFRIVSPEMPNEVKSVLWPMELGQLVSQRDVGRVKNRLSDQGKEVLETAITEFVNKQLEQIYELKAGEIPEQIQAMEKAEMLSKAYPASDAGKEAKELWSTWQKEGELRKEIVALQALEKTGSRLSSLPHPRRVSTLEGFVKRYEGTYAATLAEERLSVETAERVSPDVDPGKTVE